MYLGFSYLSKLSLIIDLLDNVRQIAVVGTEFLCHVDHEGVLDAISVADARLQS